MIVGDNQDVADRAASITDQMIHMYQVGTTMWQNAKRSGASELVTEQTISEIQTRQQKEAAAKQQSPTAQPNAAATFADQIAPLELSK